MVKYAKKMRRAFRKTLKKTKKRAIKHYTRNKISFRVPLNGFPKFYITKNKYVDHISLDPGVGSAFVQYVYSANGIFDPDYTSIGHQPMGVDQLFLIYSTATVLKSFIKVTPVYPHTDSEPQYIGIQCSATAGIDAVTTSFNNFAESATTRGFKHFGNYINKQWGNYVKASFNKKKWFKDRDNGREHQCDVASNPVEQCFYKIISFSTPNGVSNGAALFCRVEIYYTVLWTELNPIAGS